MPAFIPDGYTAHGYIQEEPRLYEALRFRYRPVSTPDSSDFFQAGPRLKARDADKRTAKLLDERLIDWDLKTADGSPVEKNQDNILHLTRQLFFRLAGIVLCTEASDDGVETDTAADEKNSQAA